MNKLDKLVAELQTDKYVCVDVYDLTHKKPFVRKLFGKQILEDHNNIIDYFRSLHTSHGIEEIQISPARKSGNSYQYPDPAFNVELVPKEKTIESQPPAPENTMIQAPITQQPPQLPQYYQHNGGMSAPEKASLLAIKEKYTDLKERYLDVKQEKRDLQSTLNTTREELQAKTIALGISDGKLQNAVAMERLKVKSFWDTEGAKKIIDGAGNLAAFAKNQSQVAESVGMAQPEIAVTATKKLMLDSIVNDNVSDSLVAELQMVFNGMYSNAEFLEDLRSLINTHKLDE